MNYMAIKTVPRILAISLGVLFLGVSVVLAQSEEPVQDQASASAPETTNYKAEIIKAENSPCSTDVSKELNCITVDVRILNKDLKGKEVTVEMDKRSDLLANVWELRPGDKVVVEGFNFSGQDVFQIVDFYYASNLLILAIFYVVLVVIIGKRQGVGALIGLAVSSLVLIYIVIPMALKGNDALLVSALGGILVLIPSIYFSHGLSSKTTVALVSTLIGVVLTTALGYFAINFLGLTGFGTEESLILVSGSEKILDMRNILLASMLIGGIGLVDDISVSQVSVIKELYEQKPTISFNQLYEKSMHVGRDHIASLVNTLFLAYAAASLPLVMLLVNEGYKLVDIVNIAVFAEEIARTLVATTGLVLVVPITTAIAAYFYTHGGEKWIKEFAKFGFPEDSEIGHGHKHTH